MSWWRARRARRDSPGRATTSTSLLGWPRPGLSRLLGPGKRRRRRGKRRAKRRCGWCTAIRRSVRRRRWPCYRGIGLWRRLRLDGVEAEWEEALVALVPGLATPCRACLKPRRTPCLYDMLVSGWFERHRRFKVCALPCILLGTGKCRAPHSVKHQWISLVDLLVQRHGCPANPTTSRNPKRCVSGVWAWPCCCANAWQTCCSSDQQGLSSVAKPLASAKRLGAILRPSSEVSSGSETTRGDDHQLSTFGPGTFGPGIPGEVTSRFTRVINLCDIGLRSVERAWRQTVSLPPRHTHFQFISKGENQKPADRTDEPALAP